jgi:hypothetical protein
MYPKIFCFVYARFVLAFSANFCQQKADYIFKVACQTKESHNTTKITERKKERKKKKTTHPR